MKSSQKDICSRIFAHRGLASKYPENSLEGIRAAIEVGAFAVEFDIHLSGDWVPIVIHDSTLNRTAEINGDIFAWKAEELQKVTIAEKNRFGNQYESVHLPLLEEMVQMLLKYPNIIVFAELKRGTIRKFGREVFLEAVIPILKKLGNRCIPISFDSQILKEIRGRMNVEIGWVFTGWNETLHKQAIELKPEYLLADQNAIPPKEPLWQGSWKWAFWADKDPDAQELKKWFAQGADIVETMRIDEVLKEFRNTGE